MTTQKEFKRYWMLQSKVPYKTKEEVAENAWQAIHNSERTNGMTVEVIDRIAEWLILFFFIYVLFKNS